MDAKVSLKFAQNEREVYYQFMSSKAHSYHPNSDSLKQKVSAFQDILQDVKNAEKSSKLANSPAWSSRLGSRDEIESASCIASASLQMAFDAFNQNELREANEKGLFRKHDLKEIETLKRRRSIQSVRSNKRQDSHSLKR